VRGLEIQPELGRGGERLREQPGAVRGDAALSAHDLVDALNRNTDVRGELDLGQPMTEVLVDENSPGCGHAVSRN
jgi:hypothetical protein